jgi:hypothetical protein
LKEGGQIKLPLNLCFGVNQPLIDHCLPTAQVGIFTCDALRDPARMEFRVDGHPAISTHLLFFGVSNAE